MFNQAAPVVDLGTLLQLAGIVAVVVVAVLATVIKSFKGGWLGRIMDNYVYADETADTKLAEIQETAERTCDLTKRNGEQIQDLSEAVVLLHRDDPRVNTAKLRRKLSVDELPNDIIEREEGE